jgi:hypothetical protein
MKKCEICFKKIPLGKSNCPNCGGFNEENKIDIYENQATDLNKKNAYLKKPSNSITETMESNKKSNHFMTDVKLGLIAFSIIVLGIIITMRVIIFNSSNKSDSAADIFGYHASDIENTLNELDYGFETFFYNEGKVDDWFYSFDIEVIDFSMHEIYSDISIYHFDEWGYYQYISNYGYLTSNIDQITLEELELEWIIDYLNSYDSSLNYEYDFFNDLIVLLNETVDFSQDEFWYNEYLNYGENSENWAEFYLSKEAGSDIIVFDIIYGYYLQQ